MAEKLLVGQRLRAKTAFTSEPTTAPFDPLGGAVFKFRDPKGGVVLPTVTRDSLGIFEAQISLTLPGTWWFRAEGHDNEANVVAVDEGPFEVLPSHF